MEFLKHYLFESQDQLREFSAEDGAKVANGEQALPEYAGEKLRYMQVALDEGNDTEDAKIQVRMAAAVLSFNEKGFLTAAEPYDGEMVSEFEREALAEFALSQDKITSIVMH